MKKRIVTIVGARPQFIKAATLSRIFKGHPQIEEILVHTGQHHDPMMSDIFFSELQIPKPAYYLDIQGGAHGQMTGRMLEAIEQVLIAEKPDAVLVYGDTNSTLAGALAAAKLNIPVIHVEAGLRSFNRTMPEEINRVLTDHVSSILLCPTRTAVENLRAEGITKGVFNTGDVMYDATLFAINSITDQQHNKLSDLTAKDYAFLTIHRAESTATTENLQKILDYVINFSVKHNLQIIFPVHPRTEKLINAIKLETNNIHFIEPLGYFETQAILSKAKYVLTDSGGLQKEAYFHQVPCITLRSETEWVETISSGWNRLWQVAEYAPRKAISDYGVGTAAKDIEKIILDTVF